MRKCISKIIEEMGFKNIDGIYTGTFLFNPTGNILKITADDLEDDYHDDAIVRFGVYNTDGELQDIHTLDQMIVIRDSQLTPIELKWEEEYLVRFAIDVEVPISYKHISIREKKMLLCEYNDDPEKLARNLAKDALEEQMASTTMKILTSQYKSIEKIS